MSESFHLVKHVFERIVNAQEAFVFKAQISSFAVKLFVRRCTPEVVHHRRAHHVVLVMSGEACEVKGVTNVQKLSYTLQRQAFKSDRGSLVLQFYFIDENHCRVLHFGVWLTSSVVAALALNSDAIVSHNLGDLRCMEVLLLL